MVPTATMRPPGAATALSAAAVSGVDLAPFGVHAVALDRLGS